MRPTRVSYRRTETGYITKKYVGHRRLYHYVVTHDGTRVGLYRDGQYGYSVRTKDLVSAKKYIRRELIARGVLFYDEVRKKRK